MWMWLVMGRLGLINKQAGGRAIRSNQVNPCSLHYYSHDGLTLRPGYRSRRATSSLVLLLEAAAAAVGLLLPMLVGGTNPHALASRVARASRRADEGGSRRRRAMPVEVWARRTTR